MLYLQILYFKLEYLNYYLKCLLLVIHFALKGSKLCYASLHFVPMICPALEMEDAPPLKCYHLRMEEIFIKVKGANKNADIPNSYSYPSLELRWGRGVEEKSGAYFFRKIPKENISLKNYVFQ